MLCIGIKGLVYSCVYGKDDIVESVVWVLCTVVFILSKIGIDLVRLVLVDLSRVDVAYRL